MNQEESSLRGTQKWMIGHGLLILLIGLLAGVGLLVSLIGGLEVFPGRLVMLELPGNSSGWVRFHIGQLLNAFLIILVALSLPVLAIDSRKAGRLGGWVIGIGWANTLFYAAALLAPNRALTFADNRLGVANLASVIGLAPALVFAVVSIVVVGVLVRHAFYRPM
ncbi:styrene-oxide isomerase StyC [Pseudomonas aeruginosa]|uniref:styrene-oxide isomerase StyC n=1 Tax=Pseudomonas aeruginosa TaxID=287 RepID=UPI00193D9410|nr:hypothetical protein [Pseudomonas aeruginosa]MBI8222862.1 hypothetical protein [Pseudomonas aeruginosa]MDP5708014.1 hypothetical protein [Pseudomonas aeruginosa]HBO0349196.1 hypothetical protein [Pseudomonas aeruginosa]